MNGQGYEFTQQENLVIGTTARYAKWWGRVSLVIGVIITLFALRSFTQGGVAALLQGVAPVIVGVFFIKAGKALQLVVDTEGDDISHMMTAVQSLGSAFLVQLSVLVIAFAIGMFL